MGASGFCRALLGLALMCLWPAQAHASRFAQLLERADALRTSDTTQFIRLLDELDRHKAQATEAQQRHLRLLVNHRRAIQGDLEAAVGDSVALIEQAPEAEIKYRSALLVANVSALTRDYIFGLRYLDRALALRDALPDPSLRHMGDSVAGTLFSEFGHYDKSLEAAERILADAPSPRLRCFSRQTRLRALHGLGKPLDEQGEVQEAIADCAAQKEHMAVSAIRSTLAAYWADKGRLRQAIALLEATLPEAEATGYTRLISEVRSLLARYHFDVGNVAVAEAHAREAVAMKGHDPLWLSTVMARRVLYEAALARQDTAAALRHYRLYAEADKARLDDIKSREYAYQLTRYEISQKNQSIQLLSNQNQLLRLQQEVARRSAWNFRLALALLAVIAASAAYWGWRARRMHRSLHQLANTDGLTGLANRRHFRASAEATLKACEQRARPVSVLLFDLDHFKQINDQCGHSSGDWVLREVARVGRQHCREGDLYGRIGGEEFAMALVDCDVDAALRIAERCRLSIQGIDATTGAGCPLPVAASIGVVSTSISGYDYEMLIAHADAAMYRSKVAGRNRVTLYQPPPVPEGGRVVTLDGRNAGTMLREY